MLLAHAHRVAAPLAEEEQHPEGQPRLAADREMCLEAFDLLVAPRAVAIGFRLGPGDAESRIVRNAALRKRPAEHGAQRIEKVALLERRRAFLVDHDLQMLTGEQHDAPPAAFAEQGQLATFAAPAVEHAPPHLLGRRGAAS
jgi:hypothetical protein